MEEKGPWVKDETEEIRKAVSNIDDVFLGLYDEDIRSEFLY